MNPDLLTDGFKIALELAESNEERSRLDLLAASVEQLTSQLSTVEQRLIAASPDRKQKLSKAASDEVEASRGAFDHTDKIYRRRFRRASNSREVLGILKELLEMDLENWEFFVSLSEPDSPGHEILLEIVELEKELVAGLS